MRVTFNSNTQNFINQAAALNQRQVALQKQLASGQRIREANDDPAAMGRALSSLSEKGRIQTLERNLNRAQLIGTFTLETLEQLKVVADEATLVANTTDGLTNTADFRARGLQVNQLLEQGLRVLNSQISGDYLFGGANTNQQPFQVVRYTEFLVDGNGDFVDLNGNPTAVPVPSVHLDENGNVINYPFLDRLGNPISDTDFVDPALSTPPNPGDPLSARDSNTGALIEWNGNAWVNILDRNGNPIIPPAGPDGSGTGFLTETRPIDAELIGKVSHVIYVGSTDSTDDVSFRVGEAAQISPYSRGSTNQQYAAFLNDLIRLRDGYFQEDLGAVESLIPNFDAGQELVNYSLVEFGALLQGIEVTTRINESRFNELEKLSSREIDIDVAETILQLNRAQVAYEAALSSGARILSLSLLDYLR